MINFISLIKLIIQIKNIIIYYIIFINVLIYHKLIELAIHWR